MEHSPTAEATRLIEPLRTSPAAKTPGMVVCSGSRPEAGRVGGGRVAAGEDEAGAVEGEGAVQPLGPRVGADEHEQGAGVQVAAVGNDQAVQLTVAVQRGDLGAGQDLDVRVAADLVGQVARHGRREVVAPNEQVDVAGAARKITAWPAELPPTTTATASPTCRAASSRAAA